MRRILGRFGYTVTQTAVRGALHLKSAVTTLGDGRLLVNPQWIDVVAFEGFTLVEVASYDKNPLPLGKVAGGNTQVDHVTVTNVYGDFVYLGLDQHEVGSRNIWIHDSTFRSNGRQGIAVTAAQGVIIERNSFTNPRRSTIDLEPTGHRWVVDHVFVLDNTVGKGRLLFVASHGQGPVNDIVISGNHLTNHGLTIDVDPPKSRRRSNWIVTNNTSATAVKSRPLRFIDIDGLVVRGNQQAVSGGDAARRELAYQFVPCRSRRRQKKKP